ncbi:MAG: hypothetical protein ACR2PM_18900, partial [Hyphomicrobiales bacterium]
VMLVWGPHTAVADTFVIGTGEKVEGKIVQARSNVVVIQLVDGNLKLAYMSEIRQVRLSTDAAHRIEGKLLHWSDGIAVVSTGEQIFRVRDGKILETLGANGTSDDLEQPSSLTDTDQQDVQSPTTIGSTGTTAVDQSNAAQATPQLVTEDPDSLPGTAAAPISPKDGFLKFLKEQAGTERAE